MGYEFDLDGQLHRVHPVYDPDRTRLSIDGRTIAADLAPGLQDGEYLLEIDGHEERVFVATAGDTHFVHLRGRVHRIEAPNALERARRAAAPSGGEAVLRAPMPGTVVRIEVEAGATVEAGRLLLTIESMKLQTAITAPEAGRVAEICVEAGATFDQGDALIRLEAADEESES